MKVKQITLGSSTLALAVLLTACSSSSSSGVQKPTHFGHGHHDNHDNHGVTNPSAIISYDFLQYNAEQYARKKFPEITGYTLSVDGKTQDGDIDLSKYPKGHSTLNIKGTVTGEGRGQSGSVTTDSVAYLFKQEYSLAVGFHDKNVTTVVNGDQETKPVVHYRYKFYHIRDITEKLPTTGKFTYLGSGKIGSKYGDDQEEVNFNYNVDFGAKTGSGSLGNITLLEGNIDKKHYIRGEATDGRYSGGYTLGFFGPDADEITGIVSTPFDDLIGIFGGTKQAK